MNKWKFNVGDKCKVIGNRNSNGYSEKGGHNSYGFFGSVVTLKRKYINSEDVDERSLAWYVVENCMIIQENDLKFVSSKETIFEVW